MDGNNQNREGIRHRIRWDNKNLAPPTAKYWHGSNGRRWAGRGRKNPHRSWKKVCNKQWEKNL